MEQDTAADNGECPPALGCHSTRQGCVVLSELDSPSRLSPQSPGTRLVMSLLPSVSFLEKKMLSVVIVACPFASVYFK